MRPSCHASRLRINVSPHSPQIPQVTSGHDPETYTIQSILSRKYVVSHPRRLISVTFFLVHYLDRHTHQTLPSYWFYRSYQRTSTVLGSDLSFPRCTGSRVCIVAPKIREQAWCRLYSVRGDQPQPIVLGTPAGALVA